MVRLLELITRSIVIIVDAPSELAYVFPLNDWG